MTDSARFRRRISIRRSEISFRKWLGSYCEARFVRRVGLMVSALDSSPRDPGSNLSLVIGAHS
jgi:hypothetical protein